jgi:polysaccharide pyruvyl transferase WcaK-like protein
MGRKRLLVAGAYGTGNLGDEAILVGILQILGKNRKYDRNQILVFSRDPQETKSLHGISAKRRNLVDLLTANDVIIGGGELFQDNGYMAVKYSILGLASKILKKHVKFYAVGVSHVRSLVAKFLIRTSLTVADEISVRDLESKKRLRQLGIQKSIDIVDDPANYVTPVTRKEASRLLSAEGVKVHDPCILIGVVSQYIRNSELNEPTQKFLLSFLEQILNKHSEVQFIFIPFNAHKDDSFDSDIINGEWLEKNLKTSKFKVLRNKYTPQQIMGMFQLLDVVVSTRLHPLIFASKTNIPGIGVDIFEKVDAFCSSHGCSVVKLHELDRLCHLVENQIVTKSKAKLR